MSRHRIYVAGAYSGGNVIQILGNIRRGVQAGYQIWQAGYAPFVPWFDWLFGLTGPGALEDYYEYSMAWLEASEAVVQVPEGVAESRGVQAEIQRARELGLPVFPPMPIEGAIALLNAFFHTKTETKLLKKNI